MAYHAYVIVNISHVNVNISYVSVNISYVNIGEIVRLSFPGTITGVASTVVRHGTASSRPPSQTQNLLESRAR